MFSIVSDGANSHLPDIRAHVSITHSPAVRGIDSAGDQADRVPLAASAVIFLMEKADRAHLEFFADRQPETQRNFWMRLISPAVKESSSDGARQSATVTWKGYS